MIKNMMKLMKIKMLIVMLILSVLTLSTYSHEEPAKTLFEKKEKEKTAKKWRETSVMKTIAWKYTIENGMEAETGVKILVQSFDREGRLAGLESYKNDSLKLIVKYDFDEPGNMITDIDYSPEGIMQEKNLFVYDHEGRVISGKSFDNENQLLGYFVINKSDDKKSIEFVKYKTNDSLEYKIVYGYTEDYDLSDYTEAKKLGPENELLLRVEKKYNEAGFTIEKAVYGSDSKPNYTFFYEPDEQGNNLKITKQLPDERIEWFDLYFYNLNNQCLEVNSFDANGNLSSGMKYTFEYYSEPN
jgi:hypothetical protein